MRPFGETEFRATHVIVCTDDQTGHQALYVDGKLIDQCDVIYACDIADATEGNVIEFSHVRVHIPMHEREYPREFATVMPWVLK